MFYVPLLSRQDIIVQEILNVNKALSLVKWSHVDQTLNN